jgi:protein kinase/serine/threonine-protein kinase
MKCPKCQFENPADTRFCGKCGASLHPSEAISGIPTETIETTKEELTTGTIFAGRYQIIEELGKGGMGKVYKALDKEVEAKVALKLIKPEIAADKNTIERFRNELRVARDISHKNICRMYDLGREGGNYFITMEYVSGEDLKSMIRMSRQLGVGTAVSIAKQVCEGLAEAHKKGIIHRDLKPGNIMIDKDGNVRIMDFGIARSVKGKGITGAGIMVGTPEYMSPEQVEGKEVDQRSDIYSLGIILYEMVTGRVPFEGDTPFTVGVKHKSEIPKDPKELNVHIPDDLSRLVLKCLEKATEKRYQSAGDVLSELAKIEEGIPTDELRIPVKKTITSKEITVKFSLRKLFIPSLVLIALVVIGVILVLFIPKKAKEILPQALSKSSIAVVPFENYSDNKEDESFSNGITEDITTQLSKISELQVCPSMSMAKYRKSTKGAKEIGNELGVGFVLGGSIRRAGDQVRVTAQLIDAGTDKQVWAEAYDRELKEIFSIQSDIAQKIAAELKAKLTPAEKEQVEKKPTKDVRAYEYSLKGREYYYRYTKEDNEQAIELYNKALEIDPDYALAHAGLGDAYQQRVFRFGFPETWHDKAIEEAQKAISLDPNLPEGYKALAAVYYVKGWLTKAVEAGEKAVKANPNSALALNALGFYYGEIGEYEKAFPLEKKAVILSPAWAYPCVDMGQVYYGLDDLARAEEWLKKAVELQPNLDHTTSSLSRFYLACGDFQKAVQQTQKFLSLSPNALSALMYAANAELFSGNYEKAQEYYQKLGGGDVELGYIYWKTGKKDEARKLFKESLDQFQKQIEQGDEYYGTRQYIAMIYSIQGNKEEALNWLQKAVDAGWLYYRYILRHPMLENIREEPRFKEIIEKTKARVDEMRRRVEKENNKTPG